MVVRGFVGVFRTRTPSGNYSISGGEIREIGVLYFHRSDVPDRFEFLSRHGLFGNYRWEWWFLDRVEECLCDGREVVVEGREVSVRSLTDV